MSDESKNAIVAAAINELLSIGEHVSDCGAGPDPLIALLDRYYPPAPPLDDSVAGLITEARQYLVQMTPIDSMTLTRYEHGGGRLFVDGSASQRQLIADFYDEANREGILWLLHNAQLLCAALEASESSHRETVEACRISLDLLGRMVRLVEAEMGEEGMKRWSRTDTIALIAELYGRLSAPMQQLTAALARNPGGEK